MNSSNIVGRIAALSGFILLMSGFVAYRTGAFGHFLDSEVALLAYSSPESEGEYAADSGKQSSSDSTTKIVDSLAQNKSGQQSSTPKKLVDMAASSKAITGDAGRISTIITDTQKIHTDSQVQHYRQTPTDSQETYPVMMDGSKSAVGHREPLLFGRKNLTGAKDTMLNQDSTTHNSVSNGINEQIRTAPTTFSSSKSAAGTAINWPTKDTTKKYVVKKDTTAAKKKR